MSESSAAVTTTDPEAEAKNEVARKFTSTRLVRLDDLNMSQRDIRKSPDHTFIGRLPNGNDITNTLPGDPGWLGTVSTAEDMCPPCAVVAYREHFSLALQGRAGPLFRRRVADLEGKTLVCDRLGIGTCHGTVILAYLDELEKERSRKSLERARAIGGVGPRTIERLVESIDGVGDVADATPGDVGAAMSHPDLDTARAIIAVAQEATEDADADE